MQETFMKKTILLAIFSLLAAVMTAQAQWNNNNDLRDKAGRMTSSASSLASRLSNELRRGSSKSRSELDEAFLASQIESVARLFEQMVSDNRRDSELRDASSILSDLVRRAPSYGSNSYYWNDLKRNFDDVQRAVGGYNGGNSGGWGNNNGGDRNNDGDKRVGSVRWVGKVDNEITLTIRNNSLEFNRLSGQDYGAGNYNFSSALPNRNVNVYVDKKKGRGKVTVLQQPDRFNNYTAVIKITDDDGGARDYEVEIYWTR
jgi:hypothetical protein